MGRIESNLRRSFSEVKKEILDIKNQILKLAENQEKLEANFQDCCEIKPAKRVRKKK